MREDDVKRDGDTIAVRRSSKPATSSWSTCSAARLPSSAWPRATPGPRSPGSRTASNSTRTSSFRFETLLSISRGNFVAQVHEWPLGNDTVKSKMEIDPTTQKDAGYYECQANNKYAIDTRGFRTDYVMIAY
ncbi:uncharacterized protein LOC135144084 isoform X3 [Zophobas morio]|uniref:uncharacterized protein LOC135144084 isoform X3 n=1 Tax=Zophobas morio TaxID=2755281 RepID=UPI003082CF1E